MLGKETPPLDDAERSDLDPAEGSQQNETNWCIFTNLQIIASKTRKEGFWAPTADSVTKLLLMLILVTCYVAVEVTIPK